MSSSQRFCLRWNNHQSNLLSVFEQLLQDESFVDVTLAVEGLYLKAHKMVLSACSPYFQTLFVNNPDKHPIVFLKDVPYSDMRSLLDFMYKGEVSVDQERLTAFLKVAESLRIKGLTEVNEEKCDLPTITSSLLSSVAGSSGDEGRGHMSAHHLLGHKRQSSSPSPLHHMQQHHSSMATYPPKRKRGRPRKLSGSELEASSLVGVVVGGVPAHNNNNHHHLSDIDLPSDKRDAGGLMLQNPAEMLETRLDPNMSKDRNMSPHRASPASLGSHHHDRASASKSPEDLAHKDSLRKVKEEPEPTPGPSSSHDPSQGYSRTSNSQDSDGGGGSGGSLAGGSYSAESRALDLKMDETQSKLKQTGSSSLGGESSWDDKDKLKGMLEPSMSGSLLPPAPVSKQPVRRRARRRASSTHDPAEQLTEMSVRGLNLFRYASVSEGVYKCIECEKANMVKTFKNKYSFQRHAFLYHEGHQRKVFPCPVCGKEFSRPDKMKNHMKTVHDCFMPKDCIVPLGFFLQP